MLLDPVARVIEVGASEMEVEYKDGREEVFAVCSGVGVGVGIASLNSSNEEARLLREELYAFAEKRQLVHICGCAYVLRVRIVENFGEDTFNVTIKRR